MGEAAAVLNFESMLFFFLKAGLTKTNNGLSQFFHEVPDGAVLFAQSENREGQLFFGTLCVRVDG